MPNFERQLRGRITTIVFVFLVLAGVTWRFSPAIASGIQALATVPAGGTGLTALTAHDVVIGNGTSPVNLAGPGTAGQCFLSNGAGADPTYQACPGSGGGGITVFSGSALTVAANTYYFPIGGGATPSTTEVNVDVEAPSAATITNFYVQMSVALGMGNTGVFTWRKAGVSQSVTCTITGAAQTSCNDLTHSFTVAQGDLIDIQLVTTGTIVVTPNIVMAVQFGTTGSNGTVNTGTLGQCGYYASTGTAISGQVCGSVYYCADATGSTTTYTCTSSPILSAYAAGNIVTFVPQASNTGGSTINIGGLGAKSIIASNTTGSALVANDLLASGVYTLEYDGTNFRKIGGPDGAWTGLTYSNGWGDFGGGNQAGQFRKAMNGDVCIRGLLAFGTQTAGTTIATLPVGYRPVASNVMFAIDNAVPPRSEEMNILTTGVLQWEGGAATVTAVFINGNTCFSVY